MLVLFVCFLADSFETMLKSLLGYHSGVGAGASESVMRKKVYENAISNALRNNFSLVLKVGTTEADYSLQLGLKRLCCGWQLVEELVDKWKCFPKVQHTPLCAHLLGLAMKTVTQLGLGERFKDETQVISFRKNHDAVCFDDGVARG